MPEVKHSKQVAELKTIFIDKLSKIRSVEKKYAPKQREKFANAALSTLSTLRTEGIDKKEAHRQLSDLAKLMLKGCKLERYCKDMVTQTYTRIDSQKTRTTQETQGLSTPPVSYSKATIRHTTKPNIKKRHSKLRTIYDFDHLKKESLKTIFMRKLSDIRDVKKKIQP